MDFRLLAATNRDLRQFIAAGRFREDLFYRLNVVEIHVPPLRARKSDIPALAETFLRRHRPDRAVGPSGFSDDAMQALLLHDYPGNVRELEHLIQRAVVVAQGPLITRQDLPGLGGASTTTGGDPPLQNLLSLPMDQAIRGLERILITRALLQAHGNKTEAARQLGIHRQYLYAKLKELGIEE